MDETFNSFFELILLYSTVIFGLVIAVIFNVVDRIRRISVNKRFQSNIVHDIDGRESDVSNKKLREYNIDDIGQLKDFLVDIFINFEQAYNNLDYDVMKQLSTKTLFSKYYTGITLDLKFGYKRIISDIEQERVIVYGIDNSDDKQVISSVIGVSYFNYKIDKNGDTISGNKNKRTIEQFEVIFERKNVKQEISKCPNCGAVLNGVRCKYCRQLIVDDSFKISSIRRIINSND